MVMDPIGDSPSPCKAAATLELTPDRWASSGWRYRVKSIRDCGYFSSPFRANYNAETSYQFLQTPSKSQKRVSTYKAHFNVDSLAQSKMYTVRSFSNTRGVPPGRMEGSAVCGTTAVGTIISGEKYSMKDIGTKST